MQTTEGEQIAQLISGYVDIILKRLRSLDEAHLDDNEENTIVEENIAPSRFVIIIIIITILKKIKTFLEF